MRGRRRQLGLTQETVALWSGCTQSYISQVETGRRPVSPALAKRLEEIYEAEPGTYTRVRFLRGRPPLPPAVLTQIQKIASTPSSPPVVFDPGRKPRYPRSTWVSGVTDPFKVLETDLGAGLELDRLQTLRPLEEHFWRKLNAIRYDSWIEKRWVVNAALTGASLAGLSPARLGCHLQVVDGKSGTDRARCAAPAFVLSHGCAAVAIFPQRCVRTAKGYRWPDHIVLVSNGLRKATGVVEIDGLSFHQDPLKEGVRDADLGVPVLHVGSRDVGRAGLMTEILDWAVSLVA